MEINQHLCESMMYQKEMNKRPVWFDVVWLDKPRIFGFFLFWNIYLEPSWVYVMMHLVFESIRSIANGITRHRSVY